jgi:glycosyltransferase involved in cell wall biosynthesis
MSSQNYNNNTVLFIVNDAEFFISHRLPIAIAAMKAGFKVHVATYQTATAKSNIEKLGFEFHSLKFYRSGTNPLKEIRVFLQVIFLLKKLKPNLIHLVTIKPILYGCLAARLVGIQGVIAAVTGLGYVFSSDKLAAKLLRTLVLAAYKLGFGHKNLRVIFQNTDDRELFVSSRIVSQEQSRLIRGSGVDMNEYFPSLEPTSVPLVILASRMLWDKGVGDFVNAARLLTSAGVKARFVLVGGVDPTSAGAIQLSQLEMWREEGCVEWWGKRNDMPAVFKQCHIVCLPSKYGEGVPKVLIEAAACGKPIVTSDAAGCRDIVRTDQNGFLVVPGDINALKDSLLILIQDSKMRAKMGLCSREIAISEFSVTTVIEQTMSIYSELSC